jgi:hypothetical protein
LSSSIDDPSNLLAPDAVADALECINFRFVSFRLEVCFPKKTTLSTMSHDDDASYKTLFSTPEVVRDLILGFIPDEWLHGLDYATLERVSGSYVTDDLRDRADDIRLVPK